MSRFAQLLLSTLFLLGNAQAGNESANITVSSSDAPAQWSLHPLIYGHVPSHAIASVIADINIPRFLIFAILLLGLAYPITHNLLLKMSRNYHAIEDNSKQIVVTHHALEAFILSLLFPFFSYFIIRINFRDTRDIDEIISNMQGACKCGLFIMVMYMFELASRFDTPRPIVIFHHTLSLVSAFFLLLFPTSIMMKTVGNLTYFICFEATTFMGLFMYRIFPNSKVTRNVMLFGMLCFGISRPLQVALIGAAIFGSWNDENGVKWQIVMQAILALILTGVQLLTMKIHYGLWKRCVARGEERNKEFIDEANP